MGLLLREDAACPVTASTRQWAVAVRPDDAERMSDLTPPEYGDAKTDALAVTFAVPGWIAMPDADFGDVSAERAR